MREADIERIKGIAAAVRILAAVSKSHAKIARILANRLPSLPEAERKSVIEEISKIDDFAESVKVLAEDPDKKPSA